MRPLSFSTVILRSTLALTPLSLSLSARTATAANTSSFAVSRIYNQPFQRLFHFTSNPFLRLYPHTFTGNSSARLSSRIKLHSLPSIPLLGSLFSSSTSSENNMGSNGSSTASGGSYPVSKPDSEWRAVLSPAQFRVIREKGTEAPYTGEYDKHMPSKGTYNCAACNAPLYTADHKFKSGCGWPAYFDSIPGAVDRHEDGMFGMMRTEIVCHNCGGHLGHVFKGEGYPTPTDERHCVNSVSLSFKDKE